MARTENLIGQTFGQLFVVSRVNERGPDGSICWCCKCECGAEAIVAGWRLRSGKTKSCGCRRAAANRRRTRHGNARRGTQTRTYRIWCGIITRCTDENHHSFLNYGGRGITICERWRIFDNFLADMGECPDGMSIERVNNDGGYEPGNCRWATTREQSRNKRTNVLAAFNGQLLTVNDISKITGVSRDTLSRRVRAGRPLLLDGRKHRSPDQ